MLKSCLFNEADRSLYKFCLLSHTDLNKRENEIKYKIHVLFSKGNKENKENMPYGIR